MQCTHSNTHTKMNLSTVKWAHQWDKTQSRELLVCSYVCALHCAQLLHTILHRTDLIVFPLTLQTITIAPMLSIWGKGRGLCLCELMHGFMPLFIISILSQIHKQKPACYLSHQLHCLRTACDVWNGFPDCLRDLTLSLKVFHCHIKSHLFSFANWTTVC